MIDRLISMILAGLCCLGLTAPAAVPAAVDAPAASANAALSLERTITYSDVPADHWSASSVNRATALGLFQGVGENTFGRGQPISRAAFVTALMRLFDWEPVTPEENAFTDVTPERWFYSAVETALANEAIAAAESTFRPTEDVTREEMASMLIRALGYTSLAGVAAGYSAPFSDVNTNRGFIVVAHDLGIVGGVGDDLFASNGTATREQAAAMLVRVHDLLTAQSTLLEEAGEYRTVTVETPAPEEGAELPTTPLEPLTELYDTLRQLKSSGADMDQAVLCLSAGGTGTVVDEEGAILSTDAFTAQQVEELLGQKGVKTYYSERYESNYCIYTPREGQTAVVWYQSEESLAAKLQLARLFGVTKFMLA
ncbi:MAG: hypothetical protein HFF82_02140 [Oscillospiraceae bacterium]|jgi:hypothetical protein|nr:hypothetical protein [Oscillospiraceae bacterium]